MIARLRLWWARRQARRACEICQENKQRKRLGLPPIGEGEG